MWMVIINDFILIMNVIIFLDLIVIIFNFIIGLFLPIILIIINTVHFSYVQEYAFITIYIKIIVM